MDSKRERNAKPGSRAGRNNVTVRGQYAVKISGLHPIFLTAHCRRNILLHNSNAYLEAPVRCAYIEIVSSDVHSCPIFSPLLLTFGSSYIRIKNVKN